ncbi:hypothetical protein ACFV1W_30225 [Kitasatospora sp. NPDC059648]|uniref:hypothetical protein n=1 Tax=Kitasatospora sp. NPDC059648 TaxID=3346894 RepID=UPI0036C30DA8
MSRRRRPAAGFEPFRGDQLELELELPDAPPAVEADPEPKPRGPRRDRGPRCLILALPDEGQR